jgi:hypothetical protein
MPNKSLPLELLIKIVNLALGDREKYPFGGIGEIPDWRTPVSSTLDRILVRDSGSYTSTESMGSNANIVDSEIGKPLKDSVVEEAEGASQTTMHTYTVMKALRLYVVIFF